MLLDPLDHQRLRVGRLVPLVVAVAPVADEVDDDVVPEAAPEAEREPDRRDRRLGIVGVDVDDRDVEALGEVARVARRAPVGRIGREADLVVRDHVQRAAGGVPAEPLEVERLGDDPLRRERRVAVDQHRHRDAGVVAPSRVERSVCSLRVRPSTTGSTASRWLGLAASETVMSPEGVFRRPSCAEVVLDVAAGTRRLRRQRLERPLALELAQDRLVRPSEHVGEDVQPAAMRHARSRPRARRPRRRARSRCRASARARRAPRSRTASGRGTRAGGTARSPRPRSGE